VVQEETSKGTHPQRIVVLGGPGVDRVYLATGLNFADALTAGAASGGAGPVLLVRNNCIPLAVYNELLRLKPGEAFILGGPLAVSDQVAQMTTCAP
jgi:putative cell wall-binding protein